MTFSRRIDDRLRGLARDERGDEGVSKMLILLLVTVPIILVLVLFGGKIVDEFQVGMCKLGIIDPPRWFLVKRNIATYSEQSGYQVRPHYEDYDFESHTVGGRAAVCAHYRVDEGEKGGNWTRPRSGEGYSEE